MNSATASPGRRRAATLRRVGWLATASLIGLALAGPGAGIAAANPDKVTLCHAAGRDDTTQFVTLEIAYNAAYGPAGHFNEDGTPQAGHEQDYIGACASTSTTTTSTTTSTSTTTESSSTSTTTTASCDEVSYDYSVTAGRHDYPLLTVTVTAPDGVPEGCERSWSLNSYTTDGPTWATSGTQALFDHDSITLDSEITSGTLTVVAPPCHGQTDFYEGTTRFDGIDGPLPHYPGVVVPNPGLIAYSNGGAACTTTTTTTSTTTQATTTQATTTQATTTQATTTQATTTQATTTQATTQATTTDATTTQATTTDATTTQATTTDATTTQATTTQATTADTGAVEAATGRPTVTPPPTDTLPASGTPGGDTWRLALLAIAGLLATLLLLTPATPAKARRR